MARQQRIGGAGTPRLEIRLVAGQGLVERYRLGRIVLGVILTTIEPARLGDGLLVAQDVLAVGGLIVIGGADALEPFATGAVSRADRPGTGVSFRR